MAMPLIPQGRRAIVLMSDGDSDFHELTREAFSATRLDVELHHVDSGHACLAFLRGEAPFVHAPRPDLLLLDLNMPGVDGREVMKRIRGDPALRTLPALVLSDAARPQDVNAVYDLGGNTFILKPTTLPALRRAVSRIARYWFELAVLPQH